MKNYCLVFVLLLTTCFLSLPLIAVNGNPVELGKVQWIRNYEEGIQLSAEEKKPVFLLFQEVPGCVTCQRYGKNVLSHPLIVEAIEELFVPVAIFNNKGGKDAQVLRYYGERAWNNPVVRIVGNNKKDLVNRVGGDYSTLGVVQAMVQSLQAVGNSVPQYLLLLEQELLSKQAGTEKAHLSMYCFWTGEKTIGQMEGVVKTLPGFMDGREVVQVEYDPAVISFPKLVQQAEKEQCASHVYTTTKLQEKQAAKVVGARSVSKESKFRLDREPKYYLSQTHYAYLPMTPLQAVKVNSAIGSRKSPDIYLSPRQLQLAAYFKERGTSKFKKAINEDFVQSWEKVSAYFEAGE